MHSCFFAGRVRHRRFSPKAHEFNYRLFLVYLDLDELEQVFSNRWFWSCKRPALAWLRRQDYIGDPRVSIKQAVRQRIEEATGCLAKGPIRMLTHLRYFGHNFNPVTFYYCYDELGEHLDYIVAEITNTPWKERHSYVLDMNTNQGSGKHMQFHLDKVFHVSPFMSMTMHYDWRFTPPGERLNVHMVNYKDQQKVFDATLRLCKKPITTFNAAWVLLRFPLMTVRVVSGIYWQALRLYLKRTPVYTHPDKITSPPTPGANR